MILYRLAEVCEGIVMQIIVSPVQIESRQKSTRRVIDGQGRILTAPDDWELLPPGDAQLTKLVKAKTEAVGGEVWLVQVKRGRRTYSQGIWVAAVHIETARCELAQRRSMPEHQQRLQQSRRRRELQQQDYESAFKEAVLLFLAFHPDNAPLADEMAEAITRHATPVGSGTVARTRRIPLPQRARSAVIAWLRHHTTRYDLMSIPRVKGMRRQVRHDLATQSLELLERYRTRKIPADQVIVPDSCPLQKAIWKLRGAATNRNGD